MSTSAAPGARAAVVTGVGVVAPSGIGAETHWKAVREGIGALEAITRDGCTDLPLRVAGEVRGFDADAVVDGRYRVQTDRFTHFAMYAAELALADAALDPAHLPEYAAGVVTAAGSGGGGFGQRELENLWARGPRHVGPYQSIAWFYAASTGQISIRHGLKGPCGVLANDEPGGLDAFAHARRGVRRGTDVVVTGAAEAPLAPYSAVCQLGYPELSTVAEPDRAYVPFTDAAAGFAPGEGGAVLVVEDADHAARRGVRARAEIAGHAATFTGSGSWAATREGLARAITGALDDAGLAPGDVDVVLADALGVRDADLAEARALHDALGDHAARVPVTAPKTGTGRAYCGGAALDVATAVLALEHGIVPPTPYVAATRADLGIDLVTTTARATAPRTALVLARGLMGGNSALVLRAI